MKATSVYDYVVTEDIPVKGATGLIEKTIQKILGRGTVTAFDQSNAILQAVLLVDMEGVDVTEVKAEVRCFC